MMMMMMMMMQIDHDKIINSHHQVGDYSLLLIMIDCVFHRRETRKTAVLRPPSH